MVFKVAVASTDEENVNEHFGKAKKFLIYRINDDESYEFIESRKNNPPCSNGSHGESIMEDTVNLIQDVKVLLVLNIGPGAIDKVVSKEIKLYTASSTIDYALKKLSVVEKDLHD